MKSATVSTKGRVTIPSELREKYGIKDGDKLEFKLNKAAIRIEPAQS